MVKEETIPRSIERLYMKKSRKKIYIACEHYDFTWSDEELKAFRHLWREGKSIPQISVELRRHQNEVAILAIDQAERKYIQPRPGGMLGSIRGA